MNKKPEKSHLKSGFNFFKFFLIFLLMKPFM